jgi:WD40 repeat protein/serine/threonine protein kinase
MAAADPKAVDVSAEEHDRVERLLADFERDWSDGQFAGLVEQLPPVGHPLRASALLSLVRLEIDQQWQHGPQRKLEAYLERWPELGTPDSVPVSLIVQEYRARARTGSAPSVDEYTRRFPRQGAELRQILASGAAGRAADETEAASALPAARPGAANVASPEAQAPAFVSPSARSSSNSLHDEKTDDGPTLPEQFDRYRILKKLGQGGMGAVYLAHDTKLDRRVALKVPKFTAGSEPENLERFYREARATATIHHPNLCPLYDVGEFNGTPYLTMAYIEGWPLAHFVRPDRRLPQAGTAALVRTVALAIAEAHKHGIIHRDLKPGNILVDKRGQPIVMDFGLARWLNADKDDVRLTKTGAILGAPVYMSPEQVYGDVEHMGPACDVYSLGVILYELLTARLPFEGGTTAVLAKTLIQAPTPPSKHRPDLDPRLEAICLKALAKQIHERYASMTDIAAALADYIRADKLEREAGTSAIGLSASEKVTFSGPASSGSGTAPRSPSAADSRPAVVRPRADQSGSFPKDPPSGARPREAERPTPSPSGRDTVGPSAVVDFSAPSPKAFIPGAGDDTSALADPSATFIRRVSPKPPPLLKHIRQSRLKLWLMVGGVAVLLAAGGVVAWLFWPGPPIGTVRIQLNPPDAQVSVDIDDRVVDPQLLAKPIELKPGRHTLVVSGGDFETLRREFTTSEGENPPLTVELIAKPKKAVSEPLPPPTAKLEDPFVGHVRPVRCVALTTDAARGVSSGDDGKLIVWNMAAHAPFFVVQASSQPIYAVALKGDGSRVVAGGADKKIRVWDLSSGAGATPAGEVEAPAPVYAVALSADGNRVLFAGEDKVVHLWEPGQQQKPKGFAGHTGTVRALALSPDGSRAASGGDDGTVRLWDLKAGKDHKTLDGQSDTVRCLAFSSDGKRVLSGGDDRILRLWDLDKPGEPKLLHGHSGSVRSVSFTGTEKGVLSAAAGPYDNSVRLWDVESGKQTRVVGRHKDGVNTVVGSRAGAQALSGSDDGTVRLWDLNRASTESALPPPTSLVEVRRLRMLDGPRAGMERVAVSRDGRRILAAGADGVARIWDVATGSEVLALTGHTDSVRFVDFSPDGTRALTCSADKTARVWDAETGDLLRTFDGHKESVESGVFTPDSRFVVTAGADKAAIRWNADTGEIVRRYEGHHTKPINWVALSRDDKRLLTASLDGTVCLWEAEPPNADGKVFQRSIKFGPDAVYSITFLPDGKRAVAAGRDCGVYILELDSGGGDKPPRRLDGHFGHVCAVAVSPSGHRVLSSAQDRTVILWDTGNGRPLARYTGHTGIVGAATFTPDGSQIVTASADRTLRLLDLPRSAYDPPPLRDAGKPTFRPLDGLKKDVESVAITPDGKRALSGSGDDSPFCVWDLAGAKQIAAFKEHAKMVHGVAVSKDGKHALTASWDKRIRLWDLGTLKPIFELTGHTAEVQSVAFSPWGGRAVSGGSDNCVRVWDLKFGKETMTCTGHTKPVWAVAFLPDGKHVLSASLDKTIRRWDADTGADVAVWQAPTEVHALAVSPDGRRALSGGKDKLVQLWDVATGQILASFVGHTNTVTGVVFSPDGRWALSGSDDRSARLWDVETGREVGRFPGFPQPVLSVAFAPDGRTALVGGRGGVVRLWTLPNFTTVAPANRIFTERLPEIDRLALSADGRLAVLGGMDSTARLWDVAAGKELRRLTGHDGPIRFVDFASDGQSVCTASEDGTVRVWSVETGAQLLRIEAHAGTTAWVSVFSPDGKHILSAGADGIAYLWSAKDGTKLRTFAKHDKMINWAAFTPDGSLVLTASHDDKFPVGVWDVATGKLVRRLDAQKGAASVAVSADGRLAIIGGTDQKVRLCLLETGELLHTFTGHKASVWGVAFTPDGRFAVSSGANNDNSVRLWDVRYGTAVTTFTGHTSGVTAVRVSPDGHWAASGAHDSSFRWWHLPPR